MAECAGGRLLGLTCLDAFDGQRPLHAESKPSALFRLRWFHVKRGTRAEIDDPRLLG